MPSVGMRRSTRVFGARVLRSGRRLWTGPHESVRGPHGENKFPELLDNSADGGGGGDADDYHKDTRQINQNCASVGMIKTEERASDGAVKVENVDKMRGIVYRRKRKRAKLCLTEDERYGKKFVRKQWRAKRRAYEFCGDNQDSVRLAIVANGSSYDCGYWIAAFLTSLLSYMTRVRIEMTRLSAFLISNPIFEAYSSRGVLFFQVNTCWIMPNMVESSKIKIFEKCSSQLLMF